MPASDQPTSRVLCGKWMPRKKTHCVRTPDHGGPCKTPEAMERQRQHAASVRPARVVTPEARARWRRAYKFSRLGITEEEFNRLLEAQGYACGMCHKPFEEGQRICIDHDHACCPVPPSGHTRSCGECVRGLLCFRCNTALGYVELFGKMARAYLDQVALRKLAASPVLTP